eukprot:236085-Rhodomonas_salina.2
MTSNQRGMTATQSQQKKKEKKRGNGGQRGSNTFWCAGLYVASDRREGGSGHGRGRMHRRASGRSIAQVRTGPFITKTAGDDKGVVPEGASDADDHRRLDGRMYGKSVLGHPAKYGRISTKQRAKRS